MKCNTLFLVFINLILVYSKTIDECNFLVNFMKQNGFTMDEDCCKEKGITCTNNKITSIEITLDSGNINFEQFPEFNNLEKLSIKGDAFQGSLPKKLFQLPIKTLVVSNSNISQLPEDIDVNNILEEIYLNDNQIKSFPYQLKNIINLNLLNLDNNNITGTLNNDIINKNFINLEILSLQNNNMKGELAIPEYVKVLNIRNNKFTSIINDSNNYELKEFIASNNEFSTGIFYSFNIPSIIKKLILDNNNIDAIPFEISFFKLLVTLNLAHNNIKEMDNGIFELENLKYFDISNNPELNVTLINFSGSKPIGICELTNTNVLCYQRNTCNNENVNNTLRECTMDEINAIKNNIDKNDEPAGVNMIFYGALYLLIQLLPSIVYLFFLGCCSKRSNGSSKNSKENESPTPPKNVSEQSTPHFNGNEVGDPSLPVN